MPKISYLRRAGDKAWSLELGGWLGVRTQEKNWNVARIAHTVRGSLSACMQKEKDGASPQSRAKRRSLDVTGDFGLGLACMVQYHGTIADKNRRRARDMR